MNQTKKYLFIVINLFILITTIIMVTITLIFGSWAARKDGGPFEYWQHIITFTILSNIFLGLVTGASAVIGLCRLKSKNFLPRQLLTWYLIAASSAMLTCLTVIFFLAPVRAASGKDYFDMILGPMFFLHFFNPILAAITYIFLSGPQKSTLKDRILSILPPTIYAIPYLINVVFLENWPDFYGITFGGQLIFIPLVFLGFCTVVFAIASGLSYCHNRQIAIK